ncbi:von Willebrand factor, type A [Pseudomonas syringae pv. aceris]|nr:von Willebrand factor, type A [Pseudomonas syringae pv. aceris]
MFEFAWPWVFALLPLPWLMRALLPMADSGEPALKVSFLSELEGLSGRRAKANLPVWRQRAPFLLIWLLLLIATARPQWLGATAGGCQRPRSAGGGRRVRLDGLPGHAMEKR